MKALAGAQPIYSADFETTTDPEDCRVWVWGIVKINDLDNWDYGIDIESFVKFMETHSAVVYFHNLKFDGMFILDHILKQGFVHVNRKPGDRMAPKTFASLIDDMGKFYSLTVCWETGFLTEFRDSYKKLPMGVARIARAFNLEMGKGDIDYHKPRPVGYEPDDDELDYLYRDIFIVASALISLMASGMTRLTIGADSLAEYKRIVSPKFFSRTFPVLNGKMDAEIRRAYRGGFTYAAPRYKGKITRSGIVLDVNSLYPSIMYTQVLPYGEPEFVEGWPEATDEYPCVVFSITFTARLKKDHIPCIQVKASSLFAGTEYLERIDEPVTLMVTNIDYELMKDHYHLNVISVGGGWRFKGRVGHFATYIEKWRDVKETSTGGRREIAKLHLNSLYGKFASNPNVTGKYPILKDGRVALTRGPEEVRDPVYTAVGVFVTSYGRDITIRAAQANYDTFAYADTDSLHLLTDDIPEELDVHDTRMGAWSLDYRFESAYIIRAKAYLEQKHNGEYKVAFAGLPEAVSRTLTYDDLKDGAEIEGKLTPRAVPGGVVLEDVTFTLTL